MKKWFDKGYGFITDSEGKEHFVHHSNIVMDGFRHLNEDDIVNFELGTGKDGTVTISLSTSMFVDSGEPIQKYESSISEKSMLQ